MGRLRSSERVRALFATAFFLCGVIPVTAVTAAQPHVADQARQAAPSDEVRPVAAVRAMNDDLDPQRPPALRVAFDEAKLSIVPPQGWTAAPATSLNPVSAPASPIYEVARFQMRVGDPSLYAQPIPITSGLVRDAGAILSVGLAREGGELVGMDVDIKGRDVEARGGFYVTEESVVYDGLAIVTRFLVARSTDRVLAVQAVADADRWTELEPAVRAAMRSVHADQDGPHGPAAPPPPPAPEPPVEAAVVPEDPTAAIRARIVARAASLLGLPYVWGGNSTTRGMDCSAYVSWAWGVDRYTTDSIWAVSHPISKDELRPGDAMNLTIGRDPARRGHIRIFEAWANEARTLVWVYEETPPRVLHRVIAYDARYQPIRLNGLSGIGDAPLVVAPPSAVEPVELPAPAPRYNPRTATPRPATPRPAVRSTPRPAATRTPSPTPRRTASPRPSGTVRPTPTPRTTATARTLTTATPVRTVAPTPRPTSTTR
ncbi:MAG TPA: NlpC/P60 family protein [Candidatus Limnocylindria bacterium]|nr:NlpC/P60 family protein [Candidatus Limnocylindria bacterium]